MQFCSLHSKDLDKAFESLSLTEGLSRSSDPARNPPTRTIVSETNNDIRLQQSKAGREGNQSLLNEATSNELSIILQALRKLREGLLAASATASSPEFSQRVHVFNIRVAILAQHPPSYHPSLLYLLSVLDTPQHPLPRSELMEMTTYLILDMATRQDDLMNAYALKNASNAKFGYENRVVDAILRSIVTTDWVLFWRIRRKVDGYVRAIMQWYVEKLRKTVLKTIGRAYMNCDVDWILQSATGKELSWENLVEVEGVGWLRDGERVTIRKPKGKA